MLLEAALALPAPVLTCCSHQGCNQGTPRGCCRRQETSEMACRGFAKTEPRKASKTEPRLRGRLAQSRWWRPCLVQARRTSEHAGSGPLRVQEVLAIKPGSQHPNGTVSSVLLLHLVLVSHEYQKPTGAITCQMQNHCLTRQLTAAAIQPGLPPPAPGQSGLGTCRSCSMHLFLWPEAQAMGG